MTIAVGQTIFWKSPKGTVWNHGTVMSIYDAVLNTNPFSVWGNFDKDATYLFVKKLGTSTGMKPWDGANVGDHLEPLILKAGAVEEHLPEGLSSIHG